MANYKKASVVVIAESTASDTIPNAASAAPIHWNTVNTLGGATAANGWTSYVIPYTGYYQINFSLEWPASVPGAGNFVVITGSMPVTSHSDYILKGAAAAGEIRNVSRVRRLLKNDYIGFYCTQNSGSAAIPAATLSIIRVGNAS
jgi:hypothetical protein